MSRPVKVRYTFDLLDRSGGLVGELRGVLPSSGSVSWSAAASVKASAKVSMVDVGQIDSWLDVRIRPMVHVNDDSWPLGVFLPDAPERRLSELERSVDVSLLDKTTILDGDSFGETFGVPRSSNVMAAVSDVVQSTGELPVGLEPSPDTLRTGIEWEPDASKLSIVNDLLEAGNYFSMFTTGTGRFRADPYVKPASRPVVTEFIDGENVELRQLYAPEFTVTHDIGKIPNRVRAVSQAEGEDEAITAEAVNDDPNDRFSIQGRGYWRTRVYSGVQITSQAALNGYVNRRLIELSSPQKTVVVDHLPQRLGVNDAVRFVSRAHNIDGLWTVQKMEWPLRFDGLVSTTLRKVVEL